MKTDNEPLSSELFFKCVSTVDFLHSNDLDYYKMNTSNSDCEQNSSSLANSDSGYLTNYNIETQSFSTNSSGISTEDLYPQSKPIENEMQVTNNVFFCENAVFDEPKLEGPPIHYEDISIDLNKYIQPETSIPVIFTDNLSTYSPNHDRLPQSGSSTLTIIENSCSNPKNEIFSFDKLKNSTEKKNKNNSQEICNSIIKSDMNTKNDFSFDNIKINTKNSNINVNIQSVSSNYSIQSINKEITAPTIIPLNVNKVFEVINDNVQKIENTNVKIINSECIPISIITNNKLSTSNIESAVIKDNTQKLVINERVKVKTSYIISKITTPNKPIVNTVNPDHSPDLFSDEEIEHDISHEIPLVSTVILSLQTHSQKPIVQNEQLIRNDRKLLRRVQDAISGVPPPPSVTILQTTVTDMLTKIHSNKHLFLTDIFGTKEEEEKKIESDNKSVKSLLIVNNKEEIERKEWPDIINCRYHGLHYNRTKVSEDFEFYCTKYATRFVGVETASSCTVWSTALPNSATKKRNARLRWGIKSPGRRLSHLAKRRITFSSSNLQASCSAASMSVIGASNTSTRQLIIDARKNTAASKRRSPHRWQKSPRKSPQKRVKTPTSSAKKQARKLNFGNEEEPKPSTSRVVSTKRALFQSPDHNRSTTSTSSEFANRNKSKRNLFLSPRKNSPAKLNKNSPMRGNCDNKKRKRAEDDCHPSKFPRSLSFDAHHSNALQIAASGVPFTRRHSELSCGSSASSVRGELSDLHKKKLLWAVSEALRSQQIGMSHPKFRTLAPILCKVVKHLMPDLLSNGPRQPGSTSDRMLRIARQHVFAITRGKSFDEIMQQVKETNANAKNLKQPIGYVPPESFKSDEQRVKSVLQDKVLNIECNQNRAHLKSPDPKVGIRDENNRARIKRQIMFDDVDVTKGLNTHR